MNTEATTSNALQLIEPETFKSLMTTAPDILEANRTSVQKAKDFGQAILDTIEGGGMTDELDAKANDYQVKIRKTYETLQDRRKPITQLLDEVKKAFTAIEAEIDPKNPNSVFARVQTYRNSFAQQKLVEQRKREEETARKLQVDKENADIRAKVDVSISNEFNGFLTRKLNELSDLFNLSTLADIDEAASLIIAFSDKYPAQHMRSITVSIPTIYTSLDEVTVIVSEIKNAKFEQFVKQYAFDIAGQKEVLSLRIPARKNELTAIAESEAKAEKAKQDALNASKADQARLNAEAAAQATQMQTLKEEAQARERKETERMALEAKERDEKAAKEAENAKQAANMQSLFDATASAEAATTSAKEAYEIEVTNNAGYLLIAQFWFEKEGMKEPVDVIEKKTFKQMKAFAEKWALKNEEMIKSPVIIYHEVAKATVKR